MGPLLSLHKNKINLLFILEYSNVLRATYFVKTVKRIRPWFIAHSAGREIIIILSILELLRILLSTFIYESILIKISMNAKIMKTEIFYRMKYELRGH